MTKVKIISNPYKKEISFQKWVEDEEVWRDINLESDPNGKLLKDSIRNGFFPFIVKDIVDIIIEEYSDNEEAVSMIFEGTSDEYKELESVCSEDDYKDKITLLKSEQYLENARDILPEIRAIYQKIDPLIRISVYDEKEQLEREVKKFTDASSDLIPICIIGNYSTGKSTFINALIGAELLPSGDEPITGKIYRISNSDQTDRACVRFIEKNNPTEIRFDEDGSKITKGKTDSELSTLIKESLQQSESLPMVIRVSKVLSLLEKYVKEHGNDVIDDLIDVSFPFGRGLWNETSNNFVIFDTPGSNSASNINHVRVLKKAMEDMSNGMPIFVSEYNSLDSTDNEKLYKDIKAMQELDSRFTMIIVNKADTADLEEDEGKVGLPKDRERRLLNLAIPKNLFGEGIFFVSSIMGLGAKINEKFSDKHYLRVYAQNKDFYSNPLDVLYQRLYRYNIMPEQLKRKAIESAEECKDTVYANSGVYSIEQEIQTFGNKYSSYNKCHQSELFLNKVIDITLREINNSKEHREITKRKLISSLEKDKQELVERIRTQNKESTDEYIAAYPDAMDEKLNECIEVSFEESLEDEKEEYTKIQEKELEIDKFVDHSKEVSNAIIQNLKKSIIKAWNEKAFDRLTSVPGDFVGDIKRAQQGNEELEAMRKQVREKSDDMIIEKKNNDFRMYSVHAFDTLDENSKQYWDKRTNDIKTVLSQIVSGSTALTAERREQLSQIIIDYEEIGYNFSKEVIIDKEKFKKGFFIGRIALWSSGEINLSKLRDFYNKTMKDKIEEIYKSIKESHEKSYKEWIESLESIIIENIVDFNPELHSQNELIKEETRQIQELEDRQKTLCEYQQEISDKMIWKTE